MIFASAAKVLRPVSLYLCINSLYFQRHSCFFLYIFFFYFAANERVRGGQYSKTLQHDLQVAKLKFNFIIYLQKNVFINISYQLV